MGRNGGRPRGASVPNPGGRSQRGSHGRAVHWRRVWPARRIGKGIDTTPTMLGTTPTMLGTTPTMLGTTPALLGCTAMAGLCTGDKYGLPDG